MISLMMIFVELLLKSRIHIGKYVDFAHRNTHGYDGAMSFCSFWLCFYQTAGKNLLYGCSFYVYCPKPGT